MQYLLVAEVDKIQSFIFRSSKLREVIGASYMLVQFCDAVRNDGLGAQKVLTSAGGSFRLVFASKQETQEAGEKLRRQFEAEIGGSITVAEPVPYDAADSKNSITAGNIQLRTAKSAGRAPDPVWHMPFQALCQSCGVEYAVTYVTDIDDPDDADGLPYCESCNRKAESARRTRKQVNDMSRSERDASLIGKILNAMEDAVGWEGVAQLNFVEDRPYEAETYAQSDGYVAYLAADGNRMGAYFSRCASPAQASELSAAVDEVTTAALADAAHCLMKLTDKSTMPILPLIFGGDDLLVLVPGPWAVDLARAYATAYEKRMTAAIERIDAEILGEDNPATVGVGLVVCKASYPFRMAHAYAEHLLDLAKDHAKESNVRKSSLCADVILGSSLVENHEDIPVLTTADTAAVLKVRQELSRISNTKRQQIKQVRSAAQDKQQWTALKARLQRIDPDILTMIERHEQNLGSSNYQQVFKLWDFAEPLTKDQEDTNAATV